MTPKQSAPNIPWWAPGLHAPPLAGLTKIEPECLYCFSETRLTHYDNINMSVFVVSYAPGFYAVPPWGSTLYTGEGRFQGESIYLCQVIQILWLGACISWVFVLFVVVQCAFVFVFVSYAPGPARTSARVCSEAECNGWERAASVDGAHRKHAHPWAASKICEQLVGTQESESEVGVSCGDCGGLGENVRKG